MARLLAALAVLLLAAAPASAGGTGTRARIRIEVARDHRDRLVRAGRIDEARAVSRQLGRLYRRAGKPVEAEWARLFADEWRLEREAQNRGPLLAIAPADRLRIAEIEESIASQARPSARRLGRLAALYEQSNLLQEAAWAHASAGRPDQARRLERRLQRILSGPIVQLHTVVIDDRRLTLAELEGGIFAVFKPKQEVWRPDQSELPEVDTYRIDRLLGVGLVPVTVARTGARAIDGREGSLQYFFKYGQTRKQLGTSARAAQSARMRDLRTLVADWDGHSGNAFVLPSGREAALDSTQSFSLHSPTPRRLEDPELAAALRSIDRRALRRAVGAPLANRLLRYWQPLIERAPLESRGPALETIGR